MGIFGWGGQSKEELKEVIVNNENLITQLRDEKIEAQISESRAQSGFNAQKESDRANYQIGTAQLKRQIEVLEADLEDAVDSEVNNRITQLDKKAHEDRLATKKELRAEFGSELDTAKKAVASLTTESVKNKGLYDGALLVIKALEGQLRDVNAHVSTLVKVLPNVSAAITTPSHNVTVGSGNKS